MKTKFLIFLAIAIIAVVAIGLVVNNEDLNINGDSAQAVVGDPIDTASRFYNDWIEALASTTTDPYELGLPSDERFTAETGEYIMARRTEAEDPVLCLSGTPPRIGAKSVFEQETKAQLMMLARGLEERTAEYALVDLEAIDGMWKIVGIQCRDGESGPEREYSFEKPGFLLQSGESGLDPNVWYLVFEENGIDGHTAPLFFSDTSTCQLADGTEQVCNPSEITNPSQAVVKGEMTESGVDVTIVEFVN